MGIEEINIEADGFVTKDTDCSWGKPLEQVTDNTANPTRECRYPHCEECRDYVSYQGANYCTVPMVITKQVWLLTEQIIADMRREIDALREMVYDVILDEKSQAETGNYSENDALCVLSEEEYNALTPIQKYWYDKSVEEAIKSFAVALKPSDEISGEPIEIRKFTPLHAKGEEKP